MNKATGSQKINLPAAPEKYNTFVFTQAFDSIRRALLPLISKDEATPRLLLQSQDGSIYELKVNNNGTLVVETGSSTITLKQKSGKDNA